MKYICETFKYTEHEICDYETDVDLDNSYYYYMITSCKYYIDQQLNDASIKNEFGLYLVQVNARSLSASFFLLNPRLS